MSAPSASFQVGYNSGVLNVPQSTIVASLNLTTLQWSIAVAIFCIGGLLGSMSGGKAADHIGRKNFLIANNVAFIAGGLCESLAGGIALLSLGRLAIGIGCGGATVVVPMYLGEIAPANLRGSLGTMNQFAMVIGILVANLLGKPLGGEHEWRYLLGLCVVPALLQIIMAPALLESPLWLLHHAASSGNARTSSKARMHAEEVLSKLRGTDDVDFDLECMLASVRDDEDEEEADEEELLGSARAAGGNRSASGAWGEEDWAHHSAAGDYNPGPCASASTPASCPVVLPPAPAPVTVEKGSLAALRPSPSAASVSSHSLWAPEHRRPLMIGFGLQLAQQFSGINAVFFYSTAFFTSAHMSDPWSVGARGKARDALAAAAAACAFVLPIQFCAHSVAAVFLSLSFSCPPLLVRLGSVLASSVNVLATGLSIYLIERMGRRKLLLISTFGMMLSCVGLTWALQAMQPSPDPLAPPPPAWVGFMSVGMVLVFVSFFEVGLGPIPWLIGAEIFPNRVRSKAMAISSTINWLSNFAVGLSFPSISLALGPASFVPFGAVLALAFCLEYKFVPETQGKTLEEIQEEFLAQGGFSDEADAYEDAAASSFGESSATPRLGLADGSDEDVDADADQDDEENGWESTSAATTRGSNSSSSSAGSGAVGGRSAAQGELPATPIPEGDESGPSEQRRVAGRSNGFNAGRSRFASDSSNEGAARDVLAEEEEDQAAQDYQRD